MSKEIEMKLKMIDALKEFMKGEDGMKFKPKEVSIEVTKGPVMTSGKGGLKELLEKASDEAPDMEDMVGMDHDLEDMDEDEEECKAVKMSPKEFFKRK